MVASAVVELAMVGHDIDNPCTLPRSRKVGGLRGRNGSRRVGDAEHLANLRSMVLVHTPRGGAAVPGRRTERA